MKTTKARKRKRAAAVACTDLLGDLWRHLKLLEMEENETARIALTSEVYEIHRSRRDVIREIQHWLLAHNYSPNIQTASDPAAACTDLLGELQAMTRRLIQLRHALPETDRATMRKLILAENAVGDAWLWVQNRSPNSISSP